MKNIETILSEAGLTLTEEQKTAINNAMGENYKPISDWQNQVDKVSNLTTQLETTKEALKKFEGVDAAALNQKIKDLETDLANKDADYQKQIADRDFNDLLKESIATAKGRNAKAIMALLDVDTLKASKNQKEDVAAALKALTEAEDSKMLFGEAETVIGEGDPIGTLRKPGSTGDFSGLRAAMGLPAESSK